MSDAQNTVWSGPPPPAKKSRLGSRLTDLRGLLRPLACRPRCPRGEHPSLDVSADVPAGPADDDGEGHREAPPTASPVGEPARAPGRSSATAPAVTEALAAAGVERTRSLLAEADRRRITAAELIEAAYVCQHWSGLTPGALFDWVWPGGWPASGVPPADVLRHERRKAAEASGRVPKPKRHKAKSSLRRAWSPR